MPPQDPPTPQEVSRDAVEIRDEDAITIQEALTIANEQDFDLGKSTLQRWTKAWYEKTRDEVRCIFVNNREGRFYKLSREDFQAWVFDQKQNVRSHEAPQDPTRPPKVSRGPARSHETSSETQENPTRIKELENENMQLKIDLEVRKQLMVHAKEEMDDLRSTNNNFLREIGALEYQLRQLPAPKDNREVEPPQTSASVDNPQL